MYYILEVNLEMEIVGIWQDVRGSCTKFLFRNIRIRHLQKEGDHNKLIFPKNVPYCPSEKLNRPRKYGQLCHS